MKSQVARDFLRDKLLSVVIPAYNEVERLPETIRRIVEYFEADGIDYELIVVDDGSTDGTAAAAQAAIAGNPHARVIACEHNRGKGHAVRTGMNESKGDLRFFTDADLSAPISEIEKLILPVAAGYDAAIGSRELPGAQVSEQPAFHHVRDFVFNLFVRALVMPNYLDTQCGFKLFTRECAEFIFSRVRLSNFSFDVEALLMARLGGFRIKEVSIEWHGNLDTRVRLFASPAIMVFELLKIRWNLARGAYHIPRRKAKAA